MRRGYILAVGLVAARSRFMRQFLSRALVTAALLCTAAATSAAAQDWAIVGVLSIEERPETALMAPSGSLVYYTVHRSGTIGTIDATTNTILPPLVIPSAKPGPLAITRDGRTLFVGNHLDEFAQQVPGAPSVFVVDTQTRSVHTLVAHARDNDVVDLALSPDERTLYAAMRFSGLIAFDVSSGAARVVSGHTCPMGLALSTASRRLFVSYQCSGPHGEPGHDAIARLDLDPAGLCSESRAWRNDDVLLACTIRGLANVGGSAAISSDGSHLWVTGNDACSRTDVYDNIGCDVVPSRIVNLVDVNTLHVTKITLGYTDSNEHVAIAPRGSTTMIGGGAALKIFDTETGRLRQRIPVTSAGTAAFSPDGRRAYVPIADAGDRHGLVLVLGPWDPDVTVDDRKVTALSVEAITGLLQLPPRGQLRPDAYNRLQREVSAEVAAIVSERELKFEVTPTIRQTIIAADPSGAVLRALLDRTLLSLTKELP